MAAIENAVRATNEAFIAAASRGDAAGMADVYTENGQALPSNSDFITGKATLRSFWQAVLDMGVKAVQLETVELESYGDTAYEVGKYTLQGDGSQVLDRGKFIVIWKQEEGQWKWHRDIFNSSLAASDCQEIGDSTCFQSPISNLQL